MRIVVEVYRDMDHAKDWWEHPTDGRVWNVVLYEVNERDEPNLNGWELQPLGDKRFSYKAARLLAKRLLLTYRGRHEVVSRIGSSSLDSDPPKKYPRSPTVYRMGSDGCEKLDSSDG